MDDLVQAQERLGRALGRARVGEDRELANQVRELGERLAHLLAGLLKMTRMHAPDNHAFDKPVADLHATLVQLGDLLGAIHLVAIEDQIYVNDIRIRAGDKAHSLSEIGTELAHHNVGGITFHSALEGPQIRALLAATAAPPAAEAPRTALARDLEQRGVNGVELLGRFRFRLAGETEPVGADPRDLVTRAVAAADEAFQNLSAGRVPNPLPLRRVVSELLRRDLGEEDLWIDPAPAAAHAVHAFRVAHLALLIGRALGLPESALQDLGLAGFYHDAGYAAAPDMRFEQHAGAGALLMLRQKGFHEAKTRRILALLEHHRDHAGSRPGLFARILRIAEDYDTLARRARRVAPTTALALMAKWSGSRYDPVLFQLFLNTLGAYPPGTILRLEDGRVMRSISMTRGPETFTTPRARGVRTPDGQAVLSTMPAVELSGMGKLKVLAPTAA